MTILIFLKFLGSLGLLIYGMKLLGESLQKMAGNQLRHIMDTLTTNRFTSFLTGAIITAIIQSSSATSVMTIGFVHAGILTFIQGLSMIMGASVGNTFVAWIMAAEFNYAISYYIFPLFFVALWLVKLRDYRSLGESIFGLCFMFLGLRLLYEFTDDLQLASNPVLSTVFGSLNDNYGSYLILLLCGGVFTLCFQSSAALMAASMILCSTGIISIYSGIALVLGENIGRGLITYYAASSANLTARRTAMAQLIFNFFGVLWVFWVFPYFIEMVCNRMGYQTTGKLEEHTLTYVLAAFHTCFNLCNVAFFIWFIKPIERMVNSLVPKNEEEDEETNELRYITGGLLATPELSVLEAQKEINGFAEMTCRMFTQVRYLLTINNTTEFRQIYMKIRKLEDASDALEEEIADYLGEVSDDLLSSDTKNQIRCMLREVSELESIADSCYILSHIISTKYHGKQLFTNKQLEHLHQLFQLTDQALQEMKRILSMRRPPAEARTANYICQEIRKFRKQLRYLNAIDVNNHEYSYHIGTMYLDIINECEKLSEYIINTIEARIESNAKED